MAPIKNILNSAAAMLSAITVASLCGGTDLISGIFTNVASEFVLPLSKHLKNALFRKHPTELNHDLQHALAESIKRALTNTATLYKEKYPDKEINEVGLEFIKQLKKEVTSLLNPKLGILVTEDELKEYIYPSEHPGSYDQLLDRLHSTYIKQNFDESFSQFFKDNFLLQVQFSFAQILKEDSFKSAKTAFRSMVQEEIRTGVANLLEGQERIEKGIEQIKNQQGTAPLGRLRRKDVEQLKFLLKKLNDPARYNPDFEKALNSTFNKLDASINNLHRSILTIGKDVAFIKKHSVSYLIIVGVILLAGISVVIALYVNKPGMPFTATFSLVNDPHLNISNQYPNMSYPAKLNLLFPDGKTEGVTINPDNKVVISKIDPGWLYKKVRVRLEDPFWRTTKDSIELTDQSVDIHICPNDRLATIEGTVSNIKGLPANIFIEGATILVGADTILKTDNNGMFRAKLPLNMLKARHEVTAYAQGFESATEYYYPSSTPLRFMLKPAKK